MRKFLCILAAVAVVAVVIPAYAEVENVKLSGDVTVRGIFKEDYGLGGIKNNDSYNGTFFNPVDDQQDFFMSQVRLRVDADVTKNISAQLELLNQRDWDGPSGAVQGSGLASGTNIGPGAAPAATNDQFDVLLNLANITIRDMYYEGLTLRVGRQDIQWGEGFVIGNQNLAGPDPSNTIAADEFSQFHSFDAIRAMYEYDPWHFDVLYAKRQENAVNLDDDEDLFGINIGRAFDRYKAEGEVYFVGMRDSAVVNAVGDTFDTTEERWDIGARGSIRPFDRLKLSGETVFQWGEEGGAGVTALSPYTLNGEVQQDVRAWAFDYRAEWDWTELPWPATLGAEWVFYSGEENSEDGKSGAYHPGYRGKFHSAIREFQGQFYLTDVPSTPGFTNEHQVLFDASFHPFNNKDLTFFSRWLMFWLDEIPVTGRGRFIGNELDMTLAYAYTEDLTFKLINAFFVPGDYFRTEGLVANQAGQTASNADEVAKLISAEVVLTF
ncbi:MAG: alginate export family protein [Candidatus Omnitrophica bacterium]|nr:alginate export family protein [Candidatus Omnitrophota bacterium]